MSLDILANTVESIIDDVDEYESETDEVEQGSSSYTNSSEESDGCNPFDSKDKPFKCGVKGCGKEFTLKRNLTDHIRGHHQGVKPHVCPIKNCGKSFLRPAHLVVHTRIHTGEKPFECPYDGCGKRWNQKSALKQHIRCHTGEKPYICGEEGCGKSFSTSSSCKRHQLTHSSSKNNNNMNNNNSNSNDSSSDSSSVKGCKKRKIYEEVCLSAPSTQESSPVPSILNTPSISPSPSISSNLNFHSLSSSPSSLSCSSPPSGHHVPLAKYALLSLAPSDSKRMRHAFSSLEGLIPSSPTSPSLSPKRVTSDSDADEETSWVQQGEGSNSPKVIASTKEELFFRPIKMNLNFVLN